MYASVQDVFFKMTDKINLTILRGGKGPGDSQKKFGRGVWPAELLKAHYPIYNQNL